MATATPTTTLHYTTLITLHYLATTATTTTTWHYTTLDYTDTTLCYTTVHNTTVRYTTVHCTTLIKPHHNYNCTATTTTTPLHYNYNYNYSCTTPHYIQQLWVRWPLQPLQPLQKTQLQPPFGPSVDSLCHPCITTTHLSYSVLSLKLPPAPCAVLLV
jgi:hypothetical protein